MDPSIEAFARILYRGDAAALRDLAAALADWRLFYAQHADDLDFDLDVYEALWAEGVNPWEVLIDVGFLHEFIFEADHRELFDEIIAGVRELRTAAGLAVDWDAVTTTRKVVPMTFLRTLGSHIRQAGSTLVMLHQASDRYVLAILPTDTLIEAIGAARQVRDGELFVLFTSPEESRKPMAEADWLTSKSPADLWNGRGKGKVSKRKVRLFGCACCRRLGPLLVDPRSVEALDTIESYAEAGAGAGDGLKVAKSLARPAETAMFKPLKPRTQSESVFMLAQATRGTLDPDQAHFWAASAVMVLTNKSDDDCHCATVRAAIALSFAAGEPQEVEHAVQANLFRCIFGNPARPVALAPDWRTSTVLDLAQSIYDRRSFDQLPILADALEDAGCDSDAILTHCRTSAPHTRGCWVLDLVLDKT